MFGNGDGPRGGKRKASTALRGLAGKRSSRGDSDFATADDYEDIMEAIINKPNVETGDEGISRSGGSGGGSGGDKGGMGKGTRKKPKLR